MTEHDNASGPLWEFLTTLSERDTKTLSQRALKATEEIGELAKKILPFDSAAGTHHRFVDSTSILEEVADVILCVTSIAMHLGFSCDQLYDMVKRKAWKWSELQTNEAGVKFPLPYEAHVSVTGVTDVNQFALDCTSIGVKPIIIDLMNPSLSHDVMTSSVHMGDNRSAYDYVCEISSKLTSRGYNVVRTKLETVPWHPMAQQSNVPKGCYFETHVSFQIPASRRAELAGDIATLKDRRIHLSRNARKKEGDTATIMMTIRDDVITREAFVGLVNATCSSLESKGWRSDNSHVIEFSIFDTNVSHDASWISASIPPITSDVQ